MAVLLQFGDELITLADDIIVLLVLVVRPVGFYDLSHSVNRAGHTIGSNEIGEIPLDCQRDVLEPRGADLLVKEIHADSKVVRHTFQPNLTVALQ